MFSSKELRLDSFQLPACSSAKQTGGYLCQVGELEPLGRRENPLQSLGLPLPFPVPSTTRRTAAALPSSPLLHFLSEGNPCSVLHLNPRRVLRLACGSLAQCPTPSGAGGIGSRSSGCSASPSLGWPCLAKAPRGDKFWSPLCKSAAGGWRGSREDDARTEKLLCEEGLREVGCSALTKKAQGSLSRTFLNA